MPTTVRPEEWIDPGFVFDADRAYALWAHMYPDVSYLTTWSEAKGRRACVDWEKQAAAVRLQKYANAFVIERLKGNL